MFTSRLLVDSRPDFSERGLVEHHAILEHGLEFRGVLVELGVVFVSLKEVAIAVPLNPDDSLVAFLVSPPIATSGFLLVLLCAFAYSATPRVINFTVSGLKTSLIYGALRPEVEPAS